MSKLTVQLVVWNGAKYLPYLFASLRKQNFKEWSLLILDNNSADNSVEIIKKELNDFLIPYKLIENKNNSGFAGGHSEAFRESNSEYVLLLNQDMYLMPDCLKKMVDFLDQHPEAGAATPRLMRWDFASICHLRTQHCHPRESGDPGVSFRPDPGSRSGMTNGRQNDNAVPGETNKIDALGLKIFRNRRVVEQSTGQEWPRDVILSGTKNLLKAGVKRSFADAQDDNIEVFGVSGAFPMYRRSALVDTILPNGNFLDVDYILYKEDVDLAYRLASRGWKSYVLLSTVAYHDRSGAGPKELTDIAALKNKQSHSSWIKYHSYKNHLMTLIKNEHGENLILDFPVILWYEFKKFIYFLLFERAVLVELTEIWKMRRELAKKRQYIKKHRKVNYKEIRKWWK